MLYLCRAPFEFGFKGRGYDGRKTMAGEIAGF